MELEMDKLNLWVSLNSHCLSPVLGGLVINPIVGVDIYPLPLDPKTMKNEGFKHPQYMGCNP